MFTHLLRAARASLTSLLGLGLGLTSAQAMSFVAEPPYLYLSGPVVREDLNTWDDAMRRFGSQIEWVVLHQSNGGDSLAGRRIGEDIRQRGLGTVALGRCSSACANMFLGGLTRQFGTPTLGTQTVLGYHGSYNRQTGAVNLERRGDYFVRMTNGLMNEDFVERFLRLEDRGGLMRFIHPDQRASEAHALVTLCRTAANAARADEACEGIPGANALDKGVVTTWATRTVPLPPPPGLSRDSQASWHATPYMGAEGID